MRKLFLSHQMRVKKVAFLTLALLAMGSLTFSPCPAEARPQDEVLANTFHCAPIGDLRTWLECFYGAAQPARTALGLRPVPPSQAQLVTAPPRGAVPAQDVGLRDAILKSALDCNGAAQGRAWLDCFYAAAEPARLRLGLSAGQKSPAPAAAPGAAAFGLTPPPAAKPVEQVSARMAAYRFDRGHLFTATLENGQVWQQIAGDDRFADWDKPAASYRVVISRGLFGSYNFRVLKSGALFKVRRLR